MAYITMYDSAWDNQFPGNPQAVAGYVDGHIGDQPNYNWLVTNFPHAYHLSIALFSSDNADCLDIEPGAASPADAAAWYGRQVARKVSRPCFYASANTMEADLIPIVNASHFPRSAIRLWSAHYGAGEHICGPSSCGLTSIEMDGTQWTSTALGRNLDQSQLLADFFGGIPFPLREGDTGPDVVILQQNLNKWKFGRLATDGVFGALTLAAVAVAQHHFSMPVTGEVDQQLWNDLQKTPNPPPAEYGPPRNLQAHPGHTSVKLTWEPPGTAGLPAPSNYEIFIYKGTHPSAANIVPSYPRVLGKVTEYQGGSLAQHALYTAHVVATGPGGSHVAPFTYASAEFTTG